jgi:hypothetical protein
MVEINILKIGAGKFHVNSANGKLGIENFINQNLKAKKFMDMKLIVCLFSLFAIIVTNKQIDLLRGIA